MRYAWDKSKNRTNIAKHSVDFADAVAVFDDPLALTQPESGTHGEPRFVTLGLDAFARHLVVVYSERGAAIRIISARLATKQERKYYES